MMKQSEKVWNKRWYMRNLDRYIHVKQVWGFQNITNSSILKLPAILNIHQFWKHLFAVISIIEAKFFAPVWTTVDYFWNAN
jgi:hypothetical protein